MTVHNSGYRQLRHGFRLFHQFDVRADDAEAVAHVYHGYLDSVSGYTVKDQSCGILFSADTMAEADEMLEE